MSGADAVNAIDRGTKPAASQQPAASTPLWPGTRYTDRDRERAVFRAFNYLVRHALNARDFDAHYGDYLLCFYTLSINFKDQNLRERAHRIGVERAREWRRKHSSLPPRANPDAVLDYSLASDMADELGVRDEKMKEQIRFVASRFSAKDFLLFDPRTEPPPDDVPADCEYDGASNPRGSRRCHVCHRRLEIRSRYDVWDDALITTFIGDHYGVELGAHYADVLKWLPTMRGYRSHRSGNDSMFFETVYAITHVVYTLNNYSEYRISPDLLPREYQFLKNNMSEALREKDPDMLGEFMETLRSFGMTNEDGGMRSGVNFLMSHQHADGSWGELDLRDRYHATWNGIAAIGDFSWSGGQNLSFPELRTEIEKWNRESQ